LNTHFEISLELVPLADLLVIMEEENGVGLLPLYEIMAVRCHLVNIHLNQTKDKEIIDHEALEGCYLPCYLCFLSENFF